MKWMPKHRLMEDIMNDIGFIKMNSGWILPRKIEGKKPVRYHIRMSCEGYDLHADKLVNGKHKTSRNIGRDSHFVDILNRIDNNEEVFVSRKFKRKYKGLKLKQHYETK